MVAEKLRFLPDVLEEHVEELAFLWGQRRAALRSPIYPRRAFLLLEERIAAHLEGILVVGAPALPLLEETLGSPDPGMAFAAAFAMFRAGGERGPQLVAEAFFGSEGERLDALTDVLVQSPPGALKKRLHEETVSATPGPPSAASAEVLAFHGGLALNAEQFGRLLRHESAEVRRLAWRAAAYETVPRPPDFYRAGLSDPDAQVRTTVAEAAAWTRQTWLLDHLRERSRAAKAGNVDDLYLLAVLTGADDIPRVVSAGRDRSLGPGRFEVLAAFGHSSAVEALLPDLESPDPSTASAAGAAFARITGQDVASGNRAPVATAAAPDEFEREFADEVMLPDPAKARAHWDKVRGDFAKGTRWTCGLDVSKGASAEILAQLDMKSRWEACLRGSFERTWQGKPRDLVLFPQPRG